MWGMVISAAVLCAGCGSLPTVRHALAAYDALAIGCDTLETSQFGDHGRWDMDWRGKPNGPWETNPILGRHPSEGTLLDYMGIWEFVILGLDRWNSPWSVAALGIIAVAETDTDVSNTYSSAMCGIGPPPLRHR
jgi:hypothetical protein